MPSPAQNPSPSTEYLGLARLMRLSLAGADLRPIAASILERASADENLTAPLLDAAIVFQILGDATTARQLQHLALEKERFYRIPAQRPARLRLLVLMAPGDLMANVPIECLLEDSDIETTLWYVTGDDDLAAVPQHDVLFVAFSETDANRPLIETWSERLAAWPRPVVNDPRHIPRVARDTAAHLLHGLPGVRMPPTARLDDETLRDVALGRRDLADAAPGMRFPLIVRPVDSHAGQHLYKVDSAAGLKEKLDAMAQRAYFVAPFVDYRNADGQFRKYRLILIEGRPYACHMAISEHWMIHYLNAGMAGDALKRAEEAAFLGNFPQGFALRHQAALAAIHAAIGLDYLGIDCAETPDGELLIFEVDHAMVVHAMDPVDVFPYKQPPMQALFAAFRDMLHRRAAKGSRNA
jgi:glutathione synthase/RimK-type ligase-like ATP-grasp enzyme